MKKILLSLAVIATGFAAQSQVICAGISPTPIVANYDFEWADPAGGDWATPNFLVAGTFVEDTLKFVDTGETGTNPQGNPIAQEGCIPLINDLTGKIAVLYRNTCEFGAKALNAQNAGAVGVLIINRDPEAIPMGGGVDGVNVTIPMVMISSTDGLTITNEMANGPVVMFLGNKTGLYPNDAGITKGTSLVSKSSGVLSQLAQDGTEFNFDIGTRVYNYGTLDQSSMTITATVDGPSGNVYDETVTLPTVLSGDSIDIDPTSTLTFPQFSLATYPDGVYTLSYDLDLGIADDYDDDNSVDALFNVQDSVFGYAAFGPDGKPSQNASSRPAPFNATFSNCVAFDNANGSRVGATGLYFQASADAGVDLSGEEIALRAYRWEDVFTDLDDPALAFNALTPVASGFYYYPSDLQGETVYGQFSSNVLLEDDQRFLFCIQTVNGTLFLGYSNEVDYDWNQAYYRQPIGPLESGGSYSQGFVGNSTSSVGVAIVDSASIGLNEYGTIEGSAYPNPAKDIVTISIETLEDATIVITDLSGKIVMNDVRSFAKGNVTIDMADLQSGMYVFNVTLANGLSSRFNVAKN